MKKTLSIIFTMFFGCLLFAQQEIVPKKKSYSETYKILEKYKITPTGSSYFSTESIICDADNIVYLIKDDGKNCTLTAHFLGSGNFSIAFPTEDLIITNCVKTVLSGYKNKDLKASILLIERKDSEKYNFMLMYTKADPSAGNMVTVKELVPVDKSFSLKEKASDIVDSMPNYKWYISDF